MSANRCRLISGGGVIFRVILNPKSPPHFEIDEIDRSCPESNFRSWQVLILNEHFNSAALRSPCASLKNFEKVWTKVEKEKNSEILFWRRSPRNSQNLWRSNPTLTSFWWFWNSFCAKRSTNHPLKSLCSADVSSSDLLVSDQAIQIPTKLSVIVGVWSNFEHES